MADIPEVVDHLCDVLAPLGGIAPRRMFGGWGIFSDTLMFVLIDRDHQPYFRADDENKGDYEALDLTRFKPRHDKPMTMPYYPLPPDLFDDPEVMLEWAGKALDAARRQKKTKR